MPLVIRRDIMRPGSQTPRRSDLTLLQPDNALPRQQRFEHLALIPVGGKRDRAPVLPIPPNLHVRQVVLEEVRPPTPPHLPPQPLHPLSPFLLKCQLQLPRGTLAKWSRPEQGRLLLLPNGRVHRVVVVPYHSVP